MAHGFDRFGFLSQEVPACLFALLGFHCFLHVPDGVGQLQRLASSGCHHVVAAP